MLEEYKKLIIVSIVGIVCIGLILMFCLVDISIGPVKIASVSTILKQHTNVKKSESELATQQNTYKTTLATLETEKENYKKEKNKYDTISDETVAIIKEATSIENYSIEYIWIKLGNYAKRNNLSVVLVEPGGTGSTTKTNTTGNATTNGGTTTNTATQDSVSKTGTTDTANTTANSNTTNTSTTGTTTTNNGSAGTTATSGTDTNANPTTGTTNNSATNTTSTSSSVLKVQVSGSYIDVSDFIFEVENDTELRFKLDNIAIEYVSGTTIKATFNVKNMIIKK